MTEKPQEQLNTEVEREKIEIAKKKMQDLRRQLEEIKNARQSNPGAAVDDYKDAEKLLAARIESLEEVIRRTQDKIK